MAEVVCELSQISVDSLIDLAYNGAREARAYLLEDMLYGAKQEAKKRAAAGETPPSFLSWTAKPQAASQQAKASTRGSRRFLLPGAAKAPLESGRMKRGSSA